MKKYITIILGIITILIIIATIYILVNSNKKVFKIPQFETNVVSSKLEVPENIEYSTLNVKEGYIVGINGKLKITKDKIIPIYFTSIDTNDVYLKIKIYDDKDVLIYESNIIKPGQRIEKVSASNITGNTNVVIKIIAYNPGSYYSEGTCTLNSRIEVGE